MKWNLAQLNIAHMRAPLDNPVMAEFVENLDRINSQAERSPGFIWRFIDEEEGGVPVTLYNDPKLLVNMSVWQSLHALAEFTYKSGHADIFRKRKEWFERMQDAHLVCWYIETGKTPTVKEAEHRLDFLRQYGETPYAFTFRKSFTVDEYLDFNKKDDQ